MDGNGPFVRASARKNKIKLFLWGSWGTGKTTLALQFPKPVVLDLDGGTDLYGSRCAFDVLRTASLKEVKQAIAWIADKSSGSEKYKTLIIDPITVYWEILQRHWSGVFLRRNRGAAGHKHEFYDMGPTEWKTIKSDFRALFNVLNSLDMHVVVTAREKAKYKAGGFMVSDGETFDCDGSAPYMFDLVVRLRHIASSQAKEGDTSKDSSGGSYLASVSKDRAGVFPAQDFDVYNINVYEKYLKSFKGANL